MSSRQYANLLKVVPLGRSQRIPLEERDDRFQQIRAATHGVAVYMLPVVVAPVVHVHLTYSEELPQLVETPDAARALSDHEVVRNLVAGLVATSVCPARLPDKSDREASFSVYETDHPATLFDQPFLLVLRITRHVVTIVNAQSDETMSSAGYPGFPAYGQMRTVLLPARGAAIYLRTVIVTAAVYRGLVSRLRPKANLST